MAFKLLPLRLIDFIWIISRLVRPRLIMMFLSLVLVIRCMSTIQIRANSHPWIRIIYLIVFQHFQQIAASMPMVTRTWSVLVMVQCSRKGFLLKFPLVS